MNMNRFVVLVVLLMFMGLVLWLFLISVVYNIVDVVDINVMGLIYVDLCIVMVFDMIFFG